MIEAMVTRNEILRIAAFAALYSALGLLIPIQGSVTFGFAIGTVVTAILYGFTLYYINTNIPLGRTPRVIISWIAVYAIQMLNPILEGFFFSTQFEGQPELIYVAVLFGLILTLPTALAAGFLFTPTGMLLSFTDLKREYFETVKNSEFVMRFVIASVLWMVIYFTFGNIIAPLVTPYYTEEGVGYSLQLPAVEIIILLQLVRGFIYILSILPLIISVNLDMKKLALILVALLYVGGAVAIFLISEQFPIILRFVHGIEMFVDSLFAAVVTAFLLGKHKKERNAAMESLTRREH